MNVDVQQLVFKSRCKFQQPDVFSTGAAHTHFLHLPALLFVYLPPDEMRLAFAVHVFVCVCLKWSLMCLVVDVCLPARAFKRVSLWRLSVLWVYALRLLIMKKVAEGNHNRYTLLRGGVFKGANVSLPRKRKEWEKNAFNWERCVR